MRGPACRDHVYRVSASSAGSLPTVPVIRSIGRFAARRRRALLVFAALLAALPIALYAVGESYRGRNFRADFARLRGTLVAAEESALEPQDGHSLAELTLRDDLGLTVRGFVKAPLEPQGPRPTLVLLGGLRTGRKTLDYVHDTRGVVLLALDYPYEGKNSGLGLWEFASALPAMHGAVLRTIPAAMLAVDYLLARPDVDPDRIVLVGGSIGALFAPAIAATDERLAGVALLFGAGDLGGLARANLAEEHNWLAGPASWVGSVLTAAVEPLEYAGDISPRPVFMLSGTGDDRMPERFSRRLHDAVGQPKKVVWIEAGHVDIRSTEFHRLVTSELVTWLRDACLIDSSAYIESG